MTRPDPAHVTVGQVRQRIYEQAGHGAPPAPSPHGALMGLLFHQVAAALTDPESPVCWSRHLGPGEAADPERLARHAYERCLGPELARRRGALDGAGGEALALWNAVQAFAGWLAGVVREAHERGAIAYDPRREQWTGADAFLRCEQALRAEFREPGWRAPVVVTGRADLVLRVPGGPWCVAELKLGSGSAEADAAQACLYHELLAREQDRAGAVALLRFGAEVEERVFTAAQFGQVRAALRALIGGLAGVTGDPVEAPPPASTGRSWPRRAGDRERDLGERLRAALEEFGTPVRLAGDPLVGPAFVRFHVEPARRVGVRKLCQQGLNLQVRLHIPRQPLIHLENGRIAVDVQRDDREAVPFSQVAGMLPAPTGGAGNPRLLAGIDFAGEPRFADFSEPLSAHILVGGTSGSGKTEWLRAAIASLLSTNTPDSLRLVLVDPKRNAFADLRGSPFLLEGFGLLYPPEDDVVAALAGLAAEMERRYKLFEQAAGCTDAGEYLRRTGELLPRIVCVCDEYADVIFGNPRAREDVERVVRRLGQKARAAGVHLVLATQRPSRSVVTGVIKANLPCRVALRVTDGLESRMILERAGAENLLGRGDLLFVDFGDPVRLQAPYLSEEERRRIFGAAG